jgi:hypothetical protein
MRSQLTTVHLYEVRPRKDKCGVDLNADLFLFGRLWYNAPDHAIGYAMHSSRSHDAVIRVRLNRIRDLLEGWIRYYEKLDSTASEKGMSSATS